MPPPYLHTDLRYEIAPCSIYSTISDARNSQSADDHEGIATSIHFRSGEQEQEQKLLNEIERLQQLLVRSHISSPHIVIDQLLMPLQHRHESEAPYDSLLEDYDGEMSMELATPLSPTMCLPPRSPSPDTHGTEENLDDDPPLMPLPPSPLLAMSPPPSQTPPLYENDNLRRVERELEAAQRQLEVGENAIHELRDALADLNLHLPIDSGAKTQDEDQGSMEEDATVMIRPSPSLR